MKSRVILFLLAVGITVTMSCQSARPLVLNKAVLDDMRRKNVDASRWGNRGQNIQFLSPGMTRSEIVKLLGRPDKYPKDQPDLLQFPPPGDFNGGKDGHDWNLVVELEDGRLKVVRFMKGIYGPPPEVWE